MKNSLSGTKATTWSARLKLWGWLSCLSIAMVTLVVMSTRHSPGGQPPQTGGAVSGSLYVQVAVKNGGDAKPAQEQIFLPDIKVYLHNRATGANSPPVVTDLFGRYAFPTQSPGTYLLHWDAQIGWEAGQHPDPIIIGSVAQYPVPARIVPVKGRGVICGQVMFADKDSTWFYDELFLEKHTANITVLNSARTTTLAGPVHANVAGWYAAAGLPQGADVTVRAQSEAASVTRAVPASAVSFGSVAALTNLQLPNHKPEILTVVPESGGAFVQTAPGGTTIDLKAVTRDIDGDPLTYSWRVLPGEGSLASTSGPSVKWTLPSFPGTHSVYLLVKDGRGGYARHRVDFDVDRTTTSFSGRAVDRRTGAPVAGAKVSVNGKTTVTAANGFFQVQAPLTKRYVFDITKTGYALFARVVNASETGQTWKLVPAQAEKVDPNKPIVLVDRRPELDRKNMRGVIVRAPARALVDSSGRRPSGLLMSYLVTYDIADGEAPGDWGGLKGGKETNLISYGAGFVEFVDAAGTKYNLAAGSTAEVEFGTPPTMLAGAPAGAPMWSYDEADGYWKESGDGVFQAATKTYVGKVKHLSAFNTDLALDQAACLKVLLYPPLPTGVRLRMTDPTGTHFTQTFDFVLDRPLRGIYRVPANIDVRLQLFDPQGNQYGNLVLEEVPGVPLPSNIVNSGPPIPSGQTLWPDEPYDTCKLVILRLDVTATPSVFLTFKRTGNDPQAQGYYKAVDPNNQRKTLGDWWHTNGFTLGADRWPLDSTNGDPTVVRTSYLNNNDLGSGRDMYFRDLGGGQLAAFVTNYGLFNQDAGNADLAAARMAPGATVCMEYSPVEGQGSTPIVKFFVFNGGDFKSNAPIQPGAELDHPFGFKFVPNLCLNCHGGDYNPANPASPTFAEINMGARFRELDTSTYKFPGGSLVPDPSAKVRFKSQNFLVKNAGSGCTSQAIRDLIAGWYPGASTDQDNSYTPPGWGAPASLQHGLYNDLVKHSCRTCHVAFDNDPSPGGISWTTYDQLKARHDTVKSFVLCNNRFMPHSVITYRNFWLSGSPHQPGVLRNYSDGSAWTAFGNCP